MFRKRVEKREKMKIGKLRNEKIRKEGSWTKWESWKERIKGGGRE